MADDTQGGGRAFLQSEAAALAAITAAIILIGVLFVLSGSDEAAAGDQLNGGTINASDDGASSATESGPTSEPTTDAVAGTVAGTVTPVQVEAWNRQLKSAGHHNLDLVLDGTQIKVTGSAPVERHGDLMAEVAAIVVGYDNLLVEQIIDNTNTAPAALVPLGQTSIRFSGSVADESIARLVRAALDGRSAIEVHTRLDRRAVVDSNVLGPSKIVFDTTEL